MHRPRSACDCAAAFGVRDDTLMEKAVRIVRYVVRKWTLEAGLQIVCEQDLHYIDELKSKKIHIIKFSGGDEEDPVVSMQASCCLKGIFSFLFFLISFCIFASYRSRQKMQAYYFRGHCFTFLQCSCLSFDFGERSRYWCYRSKRTSE